MVLQRLDNGSAVKVQALVDSGCTGSCINQKFVDLHGLETRKLPYPISVYNADGTVNRDGSIKEFVKIRIKIQKHEECIDLAVTNLGDTDLYLGYEWLIRHNPTVDWIQRSITFDNCPEECGYKIRVVIGEPTDTLEDGDRLLLLGQHSKYRAFVSLIRASRAKRTHIRINRRVRTNQSQQKRTGPYMEDRDERMSTTTEQKVDA